MNRRAFGLSVAALTWPVSAIAQRRWRETGAANRPPTAKTEAEKRILSALDRMRRDGELYLAVDEDNGRMLRLLTESSGAKNVVEIGTSTGYSSLWLCLGLQATGGKLTTFEIDPGRAQRATRNFEQAGVRDAVQVVLGDAHQTVKQLKNPIDLLFLDADKEGYASYLRTLLPLVRPGGLITADNIEMAPDYVSAVTTDAALDTVLFGRFGVTLKKR